MELIEEFKNVIDLCAQINITNDKIIEKLKREIETQCKIIEMLEEVINEKQIVIDELMRRLNK